MWDSNVQTVAHPHLPAALSGREKMKQVDGRDARPQAQLSTLGHRAWKNKITTPGRKPGHADQWLASA